MCIDTFDIVCWKCLNLIDTLEHQHISLGEIPQLLHVVGYKEQGEICCSECQRELDVLELYVGNEADKKELVEATLELIVEKISSKIDYCSKCPDAQDMEDLTSRYNKECEKDNENNHMTLPGIDVEDFLREEFIEEQYSDRVMEKMRCPSCGHGEPYHPRHAPDTCAFENTDRIYTSDEIDSFWGYSDKEFIDLGSTYGVSITKGDLELFREHIYSYPLLAYKHPVGIKIHSLLKAHFENDDVYSIDEKDVLYRGRTRKKDKDAFTEDELWTPPQGDASHGRYNAIGLSILYCSSDEEAIPYEIYPTNDEVIDLAEIKVKNRFKLFDIDKAFKGFEGFYSSKNEESKTLKKAYVFTNYIGTCCAEIGFQGVKYCSVGSKGCINYALFNYKKNEDIELSFSRTLTIEIIYK